MDTVTNSKLKAALLAKDPVEALSQNVREMKANGLSQQEVYDIFNELLQSPRVRENEQQEDAIRDVMDFIAGWCSPEARLFDTYLQA